MGVKGWARALSAIHAIWTIPRERYGTALREFYENVDIHASACDRIASVPSDRVGSSVNLYLSGALPICQAAFAVRPNDIQATFQVGRMLEWVLGEQVWERVRRAV